MKLTVTVITRDEAANIGAALESVSWADEIIVVDSQSTDDTVSIARGLATQVVTRAWPGYSAQKNYAAEIASNDWILSLDADERVPPELAEEIKELLRSGPRLCGYRIPRVTWYLGRWIRSTDWYPDYQLRLYDRRSSRWNGRRVHESVEPNRPPGQLKHELQHYAYRNISHHLATIDKYTSLAAEQWFAEGRRTGAVEMFFHPRFAFIRNYLLRGGFRDGAVGLLVSRMNAYYVFLKLAKLWELQNRTSAGLKDQGSGLKNQDSGLKIDNPQSPISKSAVAHRPSPIDRN